jgi:hypothetical protein
MQKKNLRHSIDGFNTDQIRANCGFGRIRCKIKVQIISVKETEK